MVSTDRFLQGLGTISSVASINRSRFRKFDFAKKLKIKSISKIKKKKKNAYKGYFKRLATKTNGDTQDVPVPHDDFLIMSKMTL